LNLGKIAFSHQYGVGAEVKNQQMKAAIYARVSTADQKYEMQLTELRDYCERMGWTPVEYAEKASSMKKRPVLDQLMADARARRFDVLIVYKLDRFARSLRQLIDNVFLLDSFGVRFICVTQGIDTDKSNPVSRLMLHIFGAFAEFERGLILERVNSGIAQAQKKGKHCGRPSKIYRRDQALELRAQGMTLRKIATKLGVSLTTIVRGLEPVPKVPGKDIHLVA
jgi:putative DNA-invertase from lambdoid prophage Rac